VVGLVGLEKKADNSFELRRLFIHRDYRRQGVARQLVVHLEQWAKAHAATSVWLSSGSPMILAHAFYKSIGYTHFKTQVLPTVEMLFFEKAV
jgi:putative acetyltransferase